MAEIVNDVLYGLPTRLGRHPSIKELGGPWRLCPKWIYFVMADCGLVKIGVSDDPARRARSLNTKTQGAQLLGATKGDDFYERKVHRYFAADRVAGEWFNPTVEMLEHIERLCRPFDKEIDRMLRLRWPWPPLPIRVRDEAWISLTGKQRAA